MARLSIAETAQRMLQIRAALRGGAPLGRACKDAGVTAGTYRRWLERYADSPLPTLVVEAPERGAFAFSQDGRRLLTFAESEAGFSLRAFDAAGGFEIASASVPFPRGGSWREIIAASADGRGESAVFLADDATLLRWDLARGEIAPCPLDLRGRGLDLRGRPGTGYRRWSKAAISPDLSAVAYWDTGGQMHAAAGPCRLRVEGLESGEILAEYEVTVTPIYAGWSPPVVHFHPTRPLVATGNLYNCVVLLDLARRSVVVDGGPQTHWLSFGPGDALLFDDWYGWTVEFNYKTAEERRLARAWGSHGSQSDRFLTATPDEIQARDRRRPEEARRIALPRMDDYQLSADGSRFAALTDLLSVWETEPLPAE